MLKQKILAIGTALLLTLSLAGCGGESTLGDIYDGLHDIPVEDIMGWGLPACWMERFRTPQTPGTKEQPRVSGRAPAWYPWTTIPEFSDSPYVTINDNVPYFTEDELTTDAFETYSELDDLGRAASHTPMCVRN